MLQNNKCQLNRWQWPICGVFKHSAIVIFNHLNGRPLFSSAIQLAYSLFSIPGVYLFSNFQPFLHLLTDSSTGSATALKSSHMRAICHFPKCIFISKVNASRVSTEHKKYIAHLVLVWGNFMEHWASVYLLIWYFIFSRQFEVLTLPRT